MPTIAIRGLGQQLLQVATEMGEPQLLLDLLALQRHRQGCGLNAGQHDLLLVEDQVDAAGAGGIEDRITAVIAPGVAERPCSDARQARLVGNLVRGISIPLQVCEDQGQESTKSDCIARRYCSIANIKFPWEEVNMRFFLQCG